MAGLEDFKFRLENCVSVSTSEQEQAGKLSCHIGSISKRLFSTLFLFVFCLLIVFRNTLFHSLSV